MQYEAPFVLCIQLPLIRHHPVGVQSVIVATHHSIDKAEQHIPKEDGDDQ